MKAKLFGLALAAAGLSGLTAQAAFAADGVSQANLDVVVNVTDSSASGGTTPTPSPDNSGGQDTSDTTGAQDLPYTGFDPRLAGLGLGAMAAGGLLIWGAKRKNDGKTFLPKAALVVAGAAGLVVAGSFTALAASEIGQTGEVDTNGDVVITIDKAKSLTGEAAFAIDLPQASTYFGLEGRIDVPEGLSLAVNGTPLTGDFSELMTVEDPAGTGHVAGTLTATVSPDAAVESFHLTYSLTAQDKRFELTLTPQAGDKVYDGTTAAGDIAFASTDEFVSGVQVGDDVTVQVAGELAGEFADRNAGEDITVEVDPAQFSLTGADAFRYQLVVIQPAADITAKPLGAAVEVEDKTYDGNDTAAHGQAVLVDSVVDGDQVALADGVTCEFEAEPGLEAAAAGIHDTACFAAGTGLVGDQAGNYELSGFESNDAEIFARELTVEGLQAQDRVYDGTTKVVIGGDGQLVGALDGDDVTLQGDAQGEFEVKNIGVDKPVTITGLSLDGADAANYYLVQPSSAATVTKRPVRFAGLKADKTYDGTDHGFAVGQATLDGKIDGDQVTYMLVLEGSYDSAKAGARVFTPALAHLLGLDAPNYQLDPTIDATIAKKPVRFAGLKADKTYDGTDHGFAVGQASLDGKINGDQVTYMLVLEGSYDSADAGTRAFTPAVAYLQGADASNYQLDPTVDATIAKRDWVARADFGVIIDNGQANVYFDHVVYEGVADRDNQMSIALDLAWVAQHCATLEEGPHDVYLNDEGYIWVDQDLFDGNYNVPSVHLHLFVTVVGQPDEVIPVVSPEEPEAEEPGPSLVPAEMFTEETPADESVPAETVTEDPASETTEAPAGPSAPAQDTESAGEDATLPKEQGRAQDSVSEDGGQPD